METSGHSDPAPPCPRSAELRRTAIANLTVQILRTPALIATCLEHLPGSPDGDADLLLAALCQALAQRPDSTELREYAELTRRVLGLTWMPTPGSAPGQTEGTSGCGQWIQRGRLAAASAPPPSARAGPEPAGAAGANAAPAPTHAVPRRYAGGEPERSAVAG